MLTKLNSKVLYVRENHDHMTTLFSVKTDLHLSGCNFIGKVLAHTGTNSHSQMWFADRHAGMVNEATIFVMSDTRFRVATDDDIRWIYRHWNNVPAEVCRENWLQNLSLEFVRRSELRRLAQLLSTEIAALHA